MTCRRGCLIDEKRNGRMPNWHASGTKRAKAVMKKTGGGLFFLLTGWLREDDRSRSASAVKLSMIALASLIAGAPEHG